MIANINTQIFVQKSGYFTKIHTNINHFLWVNYVFTVNSLVLY